MHQLPGEVDRTGSPVLDLLLDEPAGNRVTSPRILLHLLLEMPGDKDQLGHIETSERVHHPVHDRTARHFEKRLGNEVGVRPQASALPGQGYDHLHRSHSPVTVL
jgi:hypothetical protein